MTSKLKKRAAGCVAVCLIATGAVTAVAEETPPPPTELAAPVKSATPVVESSQARRFAEFRRDRDEADEIPAELQRRLAEWGEGEKRWGANPRLARGVAPGTWLVPGDDFVCLATIAPTDGAIVFSCATPQDVDEGLLQPASVNADGEGVLTGVMADGVESVTIVDRDGSSRVVEVGRNVYRTAIDADIQEVRWVDSDGVEHARPMPWTG